jgi:hypothetical protein
MSCDRIAEALHHLPEKQLTGHNRLEGFETQISRPGTPSISFTRGDLHAAAFTRAFLTASLTEATNGLSTSTNAKTQSTILQFVFCEKMKMRYGMTEARPFRRISVEDSGLTQSG